MAKSAFCIVNNPTNALKLIASLRSAFAESDISVLLPDTSGSASESSTPRTTADGTGDGSLLSGLEPVAIPGVGPFLASGPLLAALSGADKAGVVEALTGLGVPEFEAQRYEEKLRDGNYLICAHSSDSDAVERARAIFEKARAEDIDVSDETAVLARRFQTVAVSAAD